MFLNNGSGLKEYIAANPALHHENATTVVHSKISDASISSAECEDEMQDEFYDAITADSSTSDEESDDDQKLVMQVFLILHLSAIKVVYSRNMCHLSFVKFYCLITFPKLSGAKSQAKEYFMGNHNISFKANCW